ncbi:hypothetical protein E4U22_005708 [Claviceps purpurea]|nr:hypothetical protein E4U22_005708 [Claviceps purpurea]
MESSTSTTTVTGPQPDFTVAAECGRGLSLQLERCKNLPSVHDGAHWAATSEKLDSLTVKMDALITKVNTITQDVGVLKTDVRVLKTDVGVLKTDVGVLKTDVGVLKTDVVVLKTDVAGLNVKVTAMDQNSMARFENSLATDTTTLAPLINIYTGEEIQGPTALHDVRGMNAVTLNSHLRALGLIPRHTVGEKRTQLLCAYGVKFTTLHH